MKIAILLYEGLTALDAVGPYEVLSRLPGVGVLFVAKEVGPKQTDTQSLSLVAKFKLTDVPKPDILVIPGGSLGTNAAVKDEDTLAWVRNAHQSTRWTTSVCTGSLILGAAGVLQGLRATTHWYARKYLAQYGAEYVPERFVQQGKVITAAGVSAGIDMALHMAAKIAGQDIAQAIQLAIEYDPQPPFNSGSLERASDTIVNIAKGSLKKQLAKEMGRAFIQKVIKPFK